MLKQKVLSLNINIGKYAQFIDETLRLANQKISSYVCIANVHMIIEAHKDKEFAKVVNGANIVTPDGMPVAKSLKLIYGIDQDRVAGMDILPDILKEAGKQKLGVFFYGSTDDVLAETKQYIEKTYPEVPLRGMYSPPFRPLTAEEEQSVINHINSSGAQIVFVVLGCPKQEKWMAQMLNKVNSLMIGIGGALPVMIEKQKRAPKWFQENSLEWLFRLIQEPRRLFKRYASTNSIFITLLVKQILSQKRNKATV